MIVLSYISYILGFPSKSFIALIEENSSIKLSRELKLILLLFSIFSKAFLATLVFIGFPIAPFMSLTAETILLNNVPFALSG